MPYSFYNILHVFSAFLILTAYGALIARVMLNSQHVGLRKLGAIQSGVGLVLLFISGMGMLGKGGFGFPGWVIMKLVIWLLLGAMVALINRKPELAKIWWVLTLILALTAVSMAVVKPF